MSKKSNNQRKSDGNAEEKEVHNGDYGEDEMQLKNSSVHNNGESYNNGASSQGFANSGQNLQKNAKNSEKNDENTKKERNWIINTGNIAIIASSLAIVIDVINKLIRMLLIVSNGLIVFMYIIAGILTTFALIACIKNGFKAKEFTIDAYFTGVAFVLLILI